MLKILAPVFGFSDHRTTLAQDIPNWSSFAVILFKDFIFNKGLLRRLFYDFTIKHNWHGVQWIYCQKKFTATVRKLIFVFLSGDYEQKNGMGLNFELS